MNIKHDLAKGRLYKHEKMALEDLNNDATYQVLVLDEFDKYGRPLFRIKSLGFKLSNGCCEVPYSETKDEWGAR